jgi:protein Tex
VSIEPNEDVSIKNLESYFLKKKGENAQQITIAIKDAYKRLLLPSIENEFRNLIKEKADKEAIAVFAENLKQLLLSPPLGSKRVLAIDPGFKSGCKIVCLDENGDLIHNENIYPHPPQNESGKAAAKINQLVSTYKIEAIAIGNGTAGRETENFIRNIRFSKDVQVFVVNENGASIYSASSIAREEFPEYDVTVRGSVSIGRRLMDPLAELVKIDPKSIGVGQYQHDVDQSLLKISLDTVVESAVNKVGINLNTASKHLLSYVSGIGVQIAQNIVDYRTKCGPFKNRSELLLVARLGNKAFEQCAGFLRIKNGESILDNTAVHPESYHVVEKMAKDAKIELHELIENDEIRKSIHLEKYVDEKIGLPTLKDILQELSKPGLDPRKIIKVFEFAKGISKPEHLTVGMKLPGIITNITNFGAFVDIGVKQDGLVHISNLADKYVSNPADVVHLNQQVYVTVLEIDLPRKRIGLSLKS